MKRFDSTNVMTSATIIDCMECEHYYTGACDGRAGACDAYEPTRKITMAEDIKTIKRRQNIIFGMLCSMFCVLCAVCIAVL